MKRFLLLLCLAVPVFCQTESPTQTVSLDPSGNCVANGPTRFNKVNGKHWGCVDSTGIGFGTWTQISGSGGGVSSIFDGSKATNSGSCGATPTFDLIKASNQNTVRFECTLSANITGVTISNPSSGAKFSVALTQAAGAYTAQAGFATAASDACEVSLTNGKRTTMFFEVAADGTTVVGTDCSSNDPADTAITGSQHKTLSCQPGLGDGLNAITAGTYLESTCWNKTGVTYTITSIQCFTDNAGTSTLNATNGASTGLLTGAVTCSSTIASGTQSGTTTIANNDFIKFSFVADGASKQTTWVVAGTY